jgi:hypothetical protein
MSPLPNPLPDAEAQCRQLADLIRPHLHRQPALIGIYSGGAWIAERKTPEAILQMPPHLWRALALASVLMGVDADITQVVQPGE